MKRFKKKHTKLPSQGAVVRMLRGIDHGLAVKYINRLSRTPDVLPLPIREACLAEFDPVRRQNIRYYPDLHNFRIYDVPNRSLPIPKFLALFEKFVDPAELKTLETALTDFRLEFGTTPEDWIRVYSHESVHSCMSSSTIVRCYAHPQNKLAIAALWAPAGGGLVARTIVNTDEKWYVRLFGDSLLVDKLQALGYKRLNHTPREFMMYGYAGSGWTPECGVDFPYFDFPCTGRQVLNDTYDPETGLVEVRINQGIR